MLALAAVDLSAKTVFRALATAAFSLGQPTEAGGRSAAPRSKLPSTQDEGCWAPTAWERLSAPAAAGRREKPPSCKLLRRDRSRGSARRSGN